MTWRIDDVEIAVVSGGRLRIDGGTMFGVVPRALWSRTSVPDDRNRIQLDTNCLLIRVGGHCVLVDTGYGGKGSDRVRRNHALQVGEPLVENLEALGVQPDQIDIVILTHLHFDHVGGCTRRRSSGRVEPVFPGARHVIQRCEWDDATGGAPEFVGQYFEEDFVALDEANLVDLIDGDTEVFPGVTCRRIGGHTRGHQILSLGHGQRTILYLADLCPTIAHLPSMWTMAYDLFPLDVRRTKPRILEQAFESRCPVIFAHDPDTKAACIERSVKETFVVGRVLDGSEKGMRSACGD